MVFEGILEKVKQKFEKAQVYRELGELDKATEAIKDITDFEIEMLEMMGKQLIETAKQIKEIQEDK